MTQEIAPQEVLKFLPLAPEPAFKSNKATNRRLSLCYAMSDIYIKAAEKVIKDSEISSVFPLSVKKEAISILVKNDLIVEDDFNGLKTYKHGKTELNIAIDYAKAKSLKE